MLTVNLFIGTHTAEEKTARIDLIAYKHHMRRLEICEDNLMADVRDWGKDFRDRLRLFRVEGWKTKLAAK